MAKQPTQPEQELGPALDILEVLSLGITRFRWWILPFTIAGLIGGCFVALIQVNSYISGAQVWVEWSEKDSTSPGEQMGIKNSRQAGKGGMNIKTELQLLQTRELDEMIVREVGVDRLTAPINPMQFDHAGTPPLTRWQHQAQDWWHNRNRKPSVAGEPEAPKLNIESPKGLAAAIGKLGKLRVSKVGDHIIDIKASSGSPELAQDLVAATVKSVIARHEQIFSRQQTDEFAGDLLEQYEERETDAENTFTTHSRDCGFYNIEEQEPLLRADLNKVQDALSKNEDELIEISTELDRSKQEIKTTDERVMVTKPETRGPNPAYTEASQNIKKKRAELATAPLTNKGTALVKLKERLENEIAQEEAFLDQLDADIVLINEHEVEEDNPEFVKLKEAIKRLELRRDTVLKLQIRNRKREKDVQAELLAMENCRPRHASMKAEIAAAERVIRNIDREQSSMVISKLMNESGLKNIRVLEEPSYNPQKHKPQRSVTVLIGLGIGLGLGILFTIIRQLLDSKFRYPKSVATSLGVPVLGVIPEQRSWRKLGHELRDKSA